MSLHEAAAALDKLIYGTSSNINLPLRIDKPELKKCNLKYPNRCTDHSLQTKMSVATQKTVQSYWDPFLKRMSNDSCHCIAVQTWQSSNDLLTSSSTTHSASEGDQYCFPLSIDAPSGDQLFALSTSEVENFDSCPTSEPAELIVPSVASSIVKPYSDDFQDIHNIEFTTLTSTMDDFAPLDPTKYKTELCRSFQVHGICKYGIRCNYAHGLNQLKVAFRHGKYKTRNCQSYHETGFCRYGARCSFIHDPEEGILKCPITEREVLEALHYRPLAEFHHHVAAITWRVFGNKCYPPTELHFFTPATEHTLNWKSSSSLFSDDGITSESSSIPMSNDMRTLDSPDEANEPPKDCELRKEDGTFDQKEIDIAAVLPVEKVVGLTDTSMEQNDDDPTERNQNLFNRREDLITSMHIKAEDSPEKDNLKVILKGGELKESRSSLILKDGFLELQSMARDAFFSPSNGSRDAICNINNVAKFNNSTNKQCKFFNRSAGSNQSLSRNNIFISGSVKSFKLEDFLRCLKTREGQNHLATWSPETDGKSPVFKQEINPPKELPFFKPDTPLMLKEGFSKGTKDMSKFKTELCRSFQYNQYCEYGESCLYAHGTKDLRLYPKHPMYRTKKCFSFHHKGFCLYGSRCQFLHDIE